MKEEIDIHNYPNRLASVTKLVKKSAISEQNKKLIFEFHEYTILDGISIARRSRYLGILKNWAVILGKDFDKASKEDIMRSVRIVQETEKYSPWTKSTYKTMLKRFYKWLKQEENPKETAWIKCKIKLTEKKLPLHQPILPSRPNRSLARPKQEQNTHNKRHLQATQA